jgi:CRP/FNR family transcriptional regulator
MSVDTRRVILSRFAFFEEVDERLRREMESAGTLVRLDAGSIVFPERGTCDKVVFLGSGEVRVAKASETQREITLYHLRPGQACFLNVACVVAGIPYPAYAVADTSVEAVAVTPSAFLGWFEKVPSMRAFVLHMMSERFVELLLRLEDVALSRLDRRLADFLLSRSRVEGDTLHLTHEAIASELGSAREVMSRMLKDFEQRGAVRLHRGRVQICEASVLDRIASGEGSDAS